MAAKIPELTPMDSSMLKGQHYDPTTSTLHVQFANGSIYRIDGVPMDKAEAFAGAASPGTFYNAKIRDNHVAVKVRG